MSSGDGVGAVVAFLFAAGPATGTAIYRSIQKKYRNKTARYVPERVVSYDVRDERSNDAFDSHVTSRQSKIDGRNDDTPDVRAAFTRLYKS